MPQTTKTSYKKTLNLPKTNFAMRANLAQNEAQSQKRWERMGIYEKILADRRDAEPFVFHDGPPYATGSLHAGTMLNRVLKDFVVRSQLMAGRRCPFVPGWDCHGLPIEHQVMVDLVESGRMAQIESLSGDEHRMAVRRACGKRASKFQKLQANQMKRLLTLADYEHPYLTMTPDYEHGALEVFAGLVEAGLVYRALKPVHWSIENQTALAEAELEYHDKEDLSIYVDFEAAEHGAVARVFGVELDETSSFMIWTTTPWTLPANLAIAVGERFRYLLVKVDGSVTVIGADLLERVTGAAGSESVEVLGETDGAALVGLGFRHPFCPRTGRIVGADYVTLEDGTGLVHTAPGHGQEDYQTALQEGLDIYCPVQADGTYDDTVPQWLVGMSIWEANEKIVDHLRASGNLFHAEAFVHSYPHDWRSKTPVIFRATEQWFIGVDTPIKGADGNHVESALTPALSRGEREHRTLRAMALEASESQIKFIPEWGRNRMRGMLESRPDWCISRQRVWGLPIPAFRLPDGEVLLTAASVRAVGEVFAARGSDAWFTEPPEFLLANYDPTKDPDCPPSLQASKPPSLQAFQKMHDIFDVWFEAGSSWHAVMRKRGLGFPIDLYLEGSDQHRGWFQLSLLPGLGVTGRSPFKSVVTHGFTVDKDGRKMSKSLGNTLEVDDLLRDFGADVCRWWVSTLAFENDVKMDLAFFDQAGESYRKVRNTLRFLLGNLFDHEPGGEPPAPIGPTSIDAWVLSRAVELQRQVRQAYETYAFRRASQLLYDFCNDTLSAFYCAAVKDRLYCDRPDSRPRRATQRVMREVMEVLCRLLAPILPHTADEAFRALCASASAPPDDERSVHLETYYTVAAVAADDHWPAVMRVREAGLKALEEAKANGIDNPLDAEVVLGDPDRVLARFEADWADMLGVSRARTDPGAEAPTVVVNDLRKEPRCDRCWKRVVTAAVRADGATLCDRCAEAVGGKAES